MFHVRSVHRETPAEYETRHPETLQHYVEMVGTFEGKTYMIEAVIAGETGAFESDKDYPAVFKHSKLNGDGIVIQSTCRGKPDKVNFAS